MIYAGFWKRLSALLLDAIIMVPLSFLIFFGDNWSRYFQIYYFVPGTIFGLWFSVYLVKKYGGTPGKLIMKIRISKLDGSPVTYKEAFLRYLVQLLISLPMSVALIIAHLKIPDAQYYGLSFMERSTTLQEYMPEWNGIAMICLQIWTWSELVVLLCNKKRRAFHDYIAGTVVVRKNV